MERLALSFGINTQYRSQVHQVWKTLIEVVLQRHTGIRILQGLWLTVWYGKQAYIPCYDKASIQGMAVNRNVRVSSHCMNGEEWLSDRRVQGFSLSPVSSYQNPVFLTSAWQYRVWHATNVKAARLFVAANLNNASLAQPEATSPSKNASFRFRTTWLRSEIRLWLARKYRL
jgi:hypothetical protein